MEKTEFIVILTEHRFLGNLLLPCLVSRGDKFLSIERYVKRRDLENPEVTLTSYEKALVEITEKYSDERLMKRFSKAPDIKAFFEGINTEFKNRYIIPFIEEYIFSVVSILMVSPVRLYKKTAKYANIYDEDELFVQPFFAHPVFFFERTPVETRYRLKVYLDNRELPLQSRNIKILTNKPCILSDQDRLIAFEKLDAKKLQPFFTKEYVSIPLSMEEKYYSGFIRKIVRDFNVKAEGFTIETGEAGQLATLSPENNLEYRPVLVLRFHYGNESFLPNAKRDTSVQFYKQDGNYFFRKIERDSEWEQTIISALGKTGLRERNGSFLLPGIDLLDTKEALYLLINWLNKNRKELEKIGIRIEQGKLDKNYFTGDQHLEIKSRVKDDWFDLFAYVTFGDFSFPFIRLKKYILNDIREFELPNGEIAIIPEEWFARFKVLLSFARTKGEKMQFPKQHYALLHHQMKSVDDSFLNLMQRLTTTPENIQLPDGLNARLRGYQKIGYRWLFGLFKNSFGGCLADDMGLGKTLQTLTLLLKLKRREYIHESTGTLAGHGQLELFPIAPAEKKNQPASLIVVPTSLVHNWEAEISKFTPALKIYKHIGSQRKSEKELETAVAFFDIILTTYGTIRNDADDFTRLKFFFLILDESQYVKNPTSKTYKAVMKLQGSHRLALTGTPIENSLSELWAQMNFLNQGMLGNLAFFRRYFITPIEKHNSKEQQEKLQIIIRPYILRRTKAEVAGDLPPLMEQTILCEMEEKQLQNYEIEKSVIRNAILSGIENNGVKNSSMIILRGLTRLRQLANHPKLLNESTAGNSGKSEEIIRMLENVVAEKNKVLIFSSFVKHLELIKTRIEKMNWKYSMLTGKTTLRGEVIREFHTDPDNHIFLISLKAGGVGLNLTGAGYVFIIDPWWNPASENQAISRAHRIGQDKHVFVYRFITQNSIEEKIRHLQTRKSSLADRFINSNNPLKEISKDEVLKLFS